MKKLVFLISFSHRTSVRSRPAHYRDHIGSHDRKQFEEVSDDVPWGPFADFQPAHRFGFFVPGLGLRHL